MVRGSFVQVVRRQRVRLGLSISEVARRSGLRQEVVSLLESRGIGSKYPSVKMVWSLARALEVPFVDLCYVAIRSGKDYKGELR